MIGESKIIGITGGIGSGKSVVSRILRLNDFLVYDCDSEAKAIMESDASVVESVIQLIGDSAYSDSGKLDRAYMASVIFNDAEKLAGINRIVHKAVSDDFVARCRSMSDTVAVESVMRKDIIFCESAILVTSRLDVICDEIWLVTAPDEMRIERVIRRNGFEEIEVRRRMDAQAEEFERLPQHKTIEIRNDGNTPILNKIMNLVNYNQNITEQICLEKF